MRRGARLHCGQDLWTMVQGGICRPAHAVQKGRYPRDRLPALGAGTLLLPGSELKIGLSVPRWRRADQLRLYPLRQLFRRVGAYEPDAIACFQSEEGSTTHAGRMRSIASNRAGPDRRPARRVLQPQGERADLAGYISASRSLMGIANKPQRFPSAGLVHNFNSTS